MKQVGCDDDDEEEKKEVKKQAMNVTEIIKQ